MLNFTIFISICHLKNKCVMNRKQFQLLLYIGYDGSFKMVIIKAYNIIIFTIFLKDIIYI